MLEALRKLLESAAFLRWDGSLILSVLLRHTRLSFHSLPMEKTCGAKESEGQSTTVTHQVVTIIIML